MRRHAIWVSAVVVSAGVWAIVVPATQAQQVIPHGQSEAPGPPLSPAEAIKKMTVPEGFQVELVASEPEIVNPVAMTFDECGRIWITESLEYPRKPAGRGRDRVKVLEDTDNDGKADKFSIFADGFNIPSGIAVGHGGVWVANSPDILFLKDTDGDGKADTREVVVTGFGRDDTHELPNSLTWGPDGWLYGWNGVFNKSHIEYRGKTYDFTCAIWRIHPRTRDFEVFCEGTSNPWGIAIDSEGSFFASACVIDHLWHLVESGYYHRQGGPYPPFTWQLDSIVDHKHQKAAYCGIHYFDSPAFPIEYCDRLYMGNIHGNCVNVDTLTRSGSTYSAHAAPDFLSAHDAWFMPVSQKTGPDGCLYILDWYDRYHCYQDANRDPKGIDRLKGRLYRVRYMNSPRAGKLDLAKETDDQLIDRLRSENVLFRDLAQRLLYERNEPETRTKLEKLVLTDSEPRKARLHALWVLVSCGPLDSGFHERLLAHKDATFRAWGVRAAGNTHKVEDAVRDKVVALSRDPSPDVQLQVAIAASKLEGVEAMDVLLDVAAFCNTDKVIPHIVWQNLNRLMDGPGWKLLGAVQRYDLANAPQLAGLLPRMMERVLGGRNPDPFTVGSLFDLGVRRTPDDVGRQVIDLMADKLVSGEIPEGARQELVAQLQRSIRRSRFRRMGPINEALTLDLALLSALWNDPDGLATAQRCVTADDMPEPTRLQALSALVFARDDALFETVSQILQNKSGSTEFRGRVLAELSKRDDDRIAELVLKGYPQLEPDLQPRAIELLTQRSAWSKALLRAIAAKRVEASALNLNQVRKLLASHDAELVKQVRAQWGTVRDDRNPQREKVIARMRVVLRRKPGDPMAGTQVFKKVCAQCHKIYGDGQEVGPDLTGSGRNDFDQLLSNVFDPSLVIGAAYQATTVATTDGRVLTGLVVEETDQRLVLKTQGGKLETIAHGDIDEKKLSALSLMPEDLEKQLSEQELCDLLSFLVLDKPPTDPSAKRLPGAP
ncbi:MAG TPA: PVC-type heme-binding CxxCH protein [Isosphaeraceae bacterium]|jgi:putative membrane-bound dehydrogenase-like protein|nr:PVC-type heme-binding CxxCH protein [Isosphaeraceae bacterium]